MKKILMVIMALVMVAVFSPRAEAADTANLGLQVTFAPANRPPVWVIEPEGYVATTGETLTFQIEASDPDGDIVMYACRWWLNGVIQGPDAMPQDAVFNRKVMPPELPTFIWNVPADISLTDVHEFEFFAIDRFRTTLNDINSPDYIGESYISKKVMITIKPPEVIAIELTLATWELTGVPLGEKRSNFNDVSVPLHSVRNTGNVGVFIDIGYAPNSGDMRIHPGLEQGTDTFTTQVGESVLSPDMRVRLSNVIEPQTMAPLPLTYGAPTQVSQPDITSMAASYEIRAYKRFPLGNGPSGQK